MKKDNNSIKTKLSALNPELNLSRYADPRIMAGAEGYFVWGWDNQYPNKIIELLNNSVTSSAAIETKIKYIVGQGLEENGALEEFQKLFDIDLTETIKRMATDLVIFGSFAIHHSRTYGGVVIPNHIDMSGIRVGSETDKLGEWKEIMWCKDWKWKLERSYPMLKFQNYYSKEKKKVKDSIQIVQSYQPLQDIYPSSDWRSGILATWVEQEISKWNLSQIRRGFRPKVFVSFFEDMTDETFEDAYYQMASQFFGLKGEDLIATKTKPDGVSQPPQVTLLSPEMFDTTITDLVAWARQEIITAHNLTSPELVGIPTPGASLGGDANKIRIANEVFQNTNIVCYQNQICKALEPILKDWNPSIQLKIKPLQIIGEEYLEDYTSDKTVKSKPMKDSESDEEITVTSKKTKVQTNS